MPTAAVSVGAWHVLDVEQAVARQGVEVATGLDADSVASRLAEHGPNRLAEPPRRPAWRAFLDQFKSLLVLVLLGAAILAGSIGDLKDALVILVVVVFNAALGFWQEHRAEATLAALRQMLSPTARVRRGGRIEEVSATDLVPGDLVLLEAGDRIPADGRLVVSHALEIEEAALTGESQPVGKNAHAVVAAAAPLAERINCAFMNTVVTRGRAELLVTATGMGTEMGRLSGLLTQAESGPTPLQRQLDAVGRRLTLIAGSVIALIFALGLLRGDPLVQTLLTSIALAVAAIPEGLPAVVTVTLAIGMHRMARQRAIVKRLSAVETLGCTTVICSDKTGTLTLNQMTVRELVLHGRCFQVSGEGYDGGGSITAADGGDVPDFTGMLQPAVLANESRIRHGAVIGDPTEGALLAVAAKAGIDIEGLVHRMPRIAEIPFDSVHKFMATFHHCGDRVRICVKGAPDVLLGYSTTQCGPAGEGKLDAAERASWTGHNERLAGQAMRVLGLATAEMPARDFDPQGDLFGYIGNLSFIGLLGIVDPPRPEVADAIALCQRAGITVKMITGDHRITAAAIARELGLTGDVIEGRELEGAGFADLEARLDDIGVFARVTPEHKLHIVRLLRARGNVVAMTGDGVNDAPALKQADIGIAMGVTGTAVTREAASMVLTDDNFATIVSAVREGRAIYDNIVKFVRFQLSTNIGAVQTVLGASLLGWSSPFTAIQILWINIIMDGPPAMSLGVEPARPGVMEEPPRDAAAGILNGRRLLGLFAYGLTMAVGTLAMFRYGGEQGTEYALTLAFTTFVLFQFFNIFNARAEHGSALNRQFFRNRALWFSLGTVLLLQALVVHWGPAQAIFHTTDLTPGDWTLAVLVASSVLLLEELRKAGLHLWRRRRG